MRKLGAVGAAFLLSLAIATPAKALVINPAIGLVDFVFFFSGPGGDVTFGGDSVLDISFLTASAFDIHVEDCCVVGDEFALVINGSPAGWDILEIAGGDGLANGVAAMGPGSTYFEAIATVLLPAGAHTIDLEQTAGIPGGTWLNVSPARAVPEPLSLSLLGLGLAGLAWKRRSR